MTAANGITGAAGRIAAGVRAGETSAAKVLEETLAAIEARADPLVAVTRLLPERAREEAAAVDAAIAAGKDPGPLAGVPYGVKDLFDVAGIPTTAGAKVLADSAPAGADAAAIEALRGAGAVLVATLNMDEFAYGFATINAYHGTTRNPHDTQRLAGGSSGGSAAMVAAGLLPFTLGSDTNGSIRVPASLCGLFGLKPTHGALPMGGVYPFAESFDDIGPFTLSAADMALVYSVLADRPAANDGKAPRLARLGGRFRENADPAQLAAIDAAAPDAPLIEIPDIARARSAAFIITAFEGGRLHREMLNRRAMDYDPQVRDRLIAGALLPGEIHREALAFRDRYRADVLALIGGFDVLLAPAAPCAAPTIADPRILIDGAMVPARADLGIHTQPISFLGLPSLAVPLNRAGARGADGRGQLPLGLQLVGQPGGEPALIEYAALLERQGMIGTSAIEGAMA